MGVWGGGRNLLPQSRLFPQCSGGKPGGRPGPAGNSTHREIITPRELLELVPKTTPIRVLRLLPIRYYGNFRILHPHPTVLRRHPFAAFGYFADTPSLRLGTSPTPLSVTLMGTSRSTYTPMGSQFVVPYG